MSSVQHFSEFHQIPVESRWFTIWDILPGVKAIYEPYHFQEVISYLIEGEQEALLFDSGMGIGNMKALVESLTEKPVTLVCSHSHFDHVGGAWQFDQAHLLNVPECVRLLEEGYRLPRDDENRSSEAFSLQGEAWFDPQSLSVKPCKVIPIEDGAAFALGNRQLRILATPGHSKDGIMLADDENKLLFTGDTVYPGPLYAFLIGESSVDTYRKTMDQLAERYKDYTLLCSHNAPQMTGDALGEIAEAFRAISEGNTIGKSYLGHTRYDFESFSIVV